MYMISMHIHISIFMYISFYIYMHKNCKELVTIYLFQKEMRAVLKWIR